MMILAFLIGALGIILGYYWGKSVGRTELERKVVNHVLESPEYGNQIVDAIRKSLDRVKT